MISLILMILAGFFNACMDLVDFHYSTSIFSNCKNRSWIDPSLSWRNKWKNGDKSQGEKILGSSTIFVFLTDFWHLCKHLMLLSIVFAIIFYQPLFVWWADIMICFAAYTLSFELFFSKILVKK